MQNIYLLDQVFTKIIFYATHVTSLIDDGTLRVYDLSTFRVIKAIRGLEAEVSSIVCIKRTGSELRDAWVAHGTKVSLFTQSVAVHLL